MEVFDPAAFQTKLDNALVAVRRILDTNRSPSFPLDVPHQYDDKYLCAELLTNATISSHLSSLELLNLTQEKLLKLIAWATNRSVTLRFKATERCTYDRTVTREVADSVKHVTDHAWGGKTTHSSSTKITEYFWNFEFEYQIYAFQGTQTENKELLTQRSSTYEITTTTNTPPKPKTAIHPSIDHQLTWLLQAISGGPKNFKIDRKDPKCHTPSRNKQIGNALNYFKNFHSWCDSVKKYFLNDLFPIQVNHNLDLSKLSESQIFVPIFPLFEEARKEGDSVVLSLSDVQSFLLEETRTVNEKLEEITLVFEKEKKIITNPEAKLIVNLKHSKNVCQHHADGIWYIEFLLRKQLVSAIGKEVTGSDLSNYMKYHNKMMFKEEFQMKPFCYAIRRNDCSPEGVIGIDSVNGEFPEPISTIVSRSEPRESMGFHINASTKVFFGGDRFLHSFVNQEFSTEGGTILNLTTRARQFSIFMVIIGKIASANLFEPKFAMIVKNKDEFKIPLELEKIPPPQAFKAAVSSISPEQERFASAYRGMQLGGTLFGIAVLQVKPQLELLLNLPKNSLTRELSLTQQILDLFMTYQIPSDLITYQGQMEVNCLVKLKAVKSNVQAMLDMISEMKQVEAKRLLQKAKVVLEGIPKGFNLEFGSNKKKKGGKKRGLVPTAEKGKRIEINEESCVPEDDAFEAPPADEAVFEESEAAPVVEDVKQEAKETLDGMTEEDKMKASIEARKKEIAEKKAMKEAEEMAAYMAEEQPPYQNRGDVMRVRLAALKKEIAEKRARDEAEEQAKVEAEKQVRSLAEEQALSASAAVLAMRIAERKMEMARREEEEAMRAYAEHEALRANIAERIEQRRREREASKAAKEREEMEAYMQEERASEEASKAMALRIAQRKAELEEKKRIQEEIELAKYQEEMDAQEREREREEMALAPMRAEKERELTKFQQTSQQNQIKSEQEIQKLNQNLDELKEKCYKIEEEIQNVISPIGENNEGLNGNSDVVDFTKIPGILDKKFSSLETDSALCATVVNTGKIWKKKYQKSLLSNQEEVDLDVDEQEKEKIKTFGLLDSLSRSGSLSFVDASLHVVLCSSYCFDKGVMDTIIQDNVNPIEKIEKGTLIIASTIHQKTIQDMVHENVLERVLTFSNFEQ